jgi:hypothetical protein
MKNLLKELVHMRLLDIIIILLIISWLGGFSLRYGGGLIHLLLVIALVILIARIIGINSNKLRGE